MAKNSITDYSKTAASNTDIQSVDIDEGCLPSGINNAIRELMADLADMNDGTVTLTSPSFAAASLTGDLSFGDNDKAIFGAGSDLQIYHDGNNSIIKDAGTGSLVINTNTFQLANAANTETILNAVENGAVTLYYDNETKLATTSTGIDVNGTVTANGLTAVNSGLTSVSIGSTGGSGARVALDGSSNGDFLGGDYSVIQNVGSKLQFIGGTPNAPIELQTHDGSGNKLRQTVASNGDISFYEDTGTTAKLFWDASAERLGIGNSSPDTNLEISDTSGAVLRLSGHTGGVVNVTPYDIGSIEFKSDDTSSGGQRVVATVKTEADTSSTIPGGELVFETCGAGGSGSLAERMRIDSSGIVLFGTTDTDPADNSTAGGLTIGQVTGRLLASVNSAETAEFNRGGSDGTVIVIRNSGSFVGSISVSGGTTSYNAFSGSHWGRLADNSKPTILRGTIIESIGTMIDWYQVEFDVDIDGETVTKRRNITKPANVEDGDTFDYVVSDDNATPSVPAGTYTGTLRLEDDEKHPHVKISDTSESKAVYGVFTAWDNDDDTVNDMYVTAVGTGVVRILSTETVAIGDLLDSNGDGTAKVQSDDIIRSRTIGKVLSTVKQETYSDGSYTVPCALYCG